MGTTSEAVMEDQTIVRQRRKVSEQGIYMCDDLENNDVSHGSQGLKDGSSWCSKVLLLTTVVGLLYCSLQHHQIGELNSNLSVCNVSLTNLQQELEAARKSILDCKEEIDEMETHLKNLQQNLQQHGTKTGVQAPQVLIDQHHQQQQQQRRQKQQQQQEQEFHQLQQEQHSQQQQLLEEQQQQQQQKQEHQQHYRPP